MRKRRPTRRGFRPARRPSPKDVFVSILHRQPCRWDILVYELSSVLAEQCRRVCGGLLEKSLRFEGDERVIVGRMLAKGWEILVARNWPAEPGDEPVNLWPVTPEAVDAANGRTGRCFDRMLRKYVDDSVDVWLPRPSRDLDKLVRALQEAVREFLGKRCMEGGDLHQCLTDPLASHEGYFPGNAMPIDPAESTGDPRRDVYDLHVTIRSQDRPEDVKRKVVQFAQEDPWISQELLRIVEETLHDEKQVETLGGPRVATIQIGDDFLYSATHLDGKTPIEILVERQPDMDPKQRERLLRWSQESFMGVFHVEQTQPEFLEVTDLQTDRRLRLTATNLDQMHRAHPGSLIASRIVPWDDYWLVSGTQSFYGTVRPDELEKTRRKAKTRSMFRPPGMEDALAQRGRDLQRQMHDAWMKLFGRDEMACGSGRQAQADLERFDHYWMEEYVQPETGKTLAQEAQEKGRASSRPQMRLPESLQAEEDVGITMHPQHGLSFHVRYGLFRSAFEGSEPLRVDQVDIVLEYLTDETVEAHLLQRMRDLYPQRTQEVLRRVLRDEEFDLERDFERVLRRFKGQQMRRPYIPITVAGS